MRDIVCKYITFIVVITGIASHTPVSAETVRTTWGGSADIAYEQGFMYMLMKGANGGISLFNMELIENDSPGFREDDSPEYDFAVWGNRRARKILTLDSPRTHSSWLVMATRYKSGKFPLKASINGEKMIFLGWDSEKNIEWCRWSEFPIHWLREGKNTIDLYCPEAENENDGWRIMISRADMFEDGGGDPSSVGDTSFASFDGGKSWKKSPFGNKSDTRAELAVMLSLDRYVPSGRLESPVIDLWKGDSDRFIVPLREIQRMTLSIESDVPEGTAVDYYFRKGTNPQPFSEEWEQYEVIGHGSRLEYEIGGAELNRRYVQFKAVLSTENPLISPVVHSAVVNAELIERIPPHDNIYVVKCDNPSIRYSSVPWEWEPWNRPELAELRSRLNIDDIISGCRTQFEAQVRVLDSVSKRWRHSSPWPGFPAPDALSILDRVESAGGGGYCSQFAHVLVGVCLSCGWPARIVNVVGHAVTEVWNDDYDKWIFFDADYVNHYNYDAETAEPLSLLDLHKHYLDYFYPQKTIEWMPGGINWTELIDGREAPVKRGSLTHHEGVRLTGFINAAFIRMVPRNNWFEKPVPIPLIHGSSSDNPMNGYIHWYDEHTPPKRNYSWYTDRPRDMWFDMNTVHIDAVSGFGNDRLFLRFETYTPGFSHFEVNVDDTGWRRTGDRWTWLLQSGRNTLRVRAVNTYGTCGKPSDVVVNHADAPFGE